MLEFLLGYCLGRSKNSESERPRYFRESPPREETKEEKRAGVVFLVVLAATMLGALTKQTDFQHIKRNSHTSKTFYAEPLKSSALTKIAHALPRCL